MSVFDECRRAFAESGWARLPGLLGVDDVEALSRWADAVCDTSGTEALKYYEASPNGGKVLSRVEDFVSSPAFPPGLLAPDSPLVLALHAVLGDEPVLFKDKLNIKPPGGGAFTVHQDGPAYEGFGVSLFITAMVAIDQATLENGCLDFVVGTRVERPLALDDRGQIVPSELEGLVFQPLEAAPGDVALFDGLVPHRSATNCTSHPRRALFLTFNSRSEGDRREEYFRAKKTYFPPEKDRASGVDYHARGRQFNLGNPFV